MKKLTLFLGCFLALNCAHAQVALFNMSANYPVEISYVFCNENQSGKTCSELNQIMVPPKKEAADKNYVFIESPKDSTVILVYSAIEKDLQGNIVAQGKYSFPSFPSSSECGYPLLPIGMKGALIFNDMSSSPIITCLGSAY